MQEDAGSVNESNNAGSENNIEEKKAPAQSKKTKKTRLSKIPTVSQVVEDNTERSDVDSKTEDSSKREDEKAEVVTVAAESEGEGAASAPADTASQTGASSSTDSTAKSSENQAQTESSAGEKADSGKEAIEEDSLEEKEELEEKRTALSKDSEATLLETVLFLESEPQTTENLSKITGFSIQLVEECIERLKDKYSSPDSGIEISKILGGYLMVPKKEYFDLVKERYGKRNEGRLSRAAIETLSIIAYSQPCSRADIESIRHVNVDNMMRILLDRNFIKEVGKKDVPGKPALYGTTKEFLEFFHLNSIEELPQLEEKDSEVFDLAR